MALAVVITALGPGAALAAKRAPVDYREWRSASALAQGTARGVSAAPADEGGGLVMTGSAGTISHAEPALGTTRTYAWSRWTSPETRPGFGATQLVASWNAVTPPGTWIEVRMRGRTTAGKTTRWYTMGRWASGDADILRTSVGGQRSRHGTVNVDTFQAAAKVRCAAIACA